MCDVCFGVGDRVKSEGSSWWFVNCRAHVS